MEVIRFLHAADLHLDTPVGGRLPADRARIRRQEIREALERIIELAKKEQVHVLLIAGDLFELPRVTPSTINYLDTLFRRIPETRVFIAPGNHDPATANSPYLTHVWPPNVHIFHRRAWEAIPVFSGALTVYGLGFVSFEERAPLLRELHLQDQACPALVVVHASDATNSPGEDSPYLPFTLEDLKRLGATYVALGHHHQPRVITDPVGGQLLGAYPGSPEGLDLTETGDHGVFLGTIEGNRVQVDFLPINRRWCRIQQVDLTQAETAADVVQMILAAVPLAARQRDLYRIQLTGEVIPELALDLDWLRTQLSQHFWYIELENLTQPAYDLEALQKEETLRGAFVRRLLELLKKETEPERQQIITKALYLGLDALTQGEVVRR